MPIDQQITWDAPPRQVEPGNRQGGVILTDPTVQADEERKRADEIRKQEDQARQDRAEARAQQGEARDEEKFDATGGGGTEGQAKTAALLSRITGGFSDIQEIATRNPASQMPGVVESVRGDLAPSGLWGIGVRNLAGADRRMVHDAQKDILDALLTLGTGAAYNQEQLEGQMVSYFPQYGDTEDEIAIKNRRLRRQVEAAKIAAGPYADDIEAAIAPFLPPLAADAGPDGVGAKDDAFSTPEDKAHRDRLQQAWNAGATPDEIFALVEADNYRVTPEMREALAGKKPGEPVNFSAPESGAASVAEEALGAAADSSVGAYTVGAANALLSGGMDELAPILGLDAELLQTAKEQLRDQYPVASFAGEVSGQAMQMAGVTKALGAAGMAGRGAALTAEVGGGAAYGAGEANEDRALGAGAGVVGALAGDYLGRKLASRLAGPEAKSAIAKVAEEAGVPEEEIVRVLTDLGKDKVQEAVGPLTDAAQQEVATLARQATGVGARSRAARKKLAEMARLDPEAAAAAERLGVEIPVDILSDNAQVQSLAGLARSQVGSDAEAAWRGVSARVSNQADQALTDLGATADLAQVSDDVLQRLDSSMQSLERQGATLRREVDAAIDVRDRVSATNLQSTLGEMINDFGGIDDARQAFSGEEKKLLAMLGMGDEAKAPTYARLNQLRDEIGRALFKGQGPWADTSQANLAKYYGALADDQLAYIESKGGAELAEKMRASNSLFSQMFDTRRDMQTIFGKQLEGSLVPLLNRALRQGSKGDAKAITQLLERVPEDMQGPVLLSAVMSQAKSSASHGGFSFANYTKLYRGLRDNGPIYKKIATAIGPEGERILTDLYAISRRMADGETKVLKTGKSNQALLSAIQAESLVSGVLKATTRRAVTGATAAAGGAVGGPGGAFAGAAIAESTQQALSQAGRTRLEKAHDLLSSPEFRGLVEEVSAGGATPGAINRLANSKGFNKFASMIGLKTPEARREWITRAMAATGSSLNPVDTPPPSPVEIR